MPESSIIAPPVIAGSGYVGECFARTRAALCLARTPARAAELKARGLQAVAWDFDGGAPAPPVLARIAGAPLLYLAPPPDAGDRDPRIGRFLAGLVGTPPVAMVYMSTTGVYGDAGGETVDETTPPAPHSARAKRRLDAEARVGDWCEARGMRWVILRVPGIYGPGRLQLERLRRGEALMRVTDAGPGNRIHVDDLVTACGAALDRPVAGVFNVGDGDHASGTEVLLTLARLVALPAPTQVARAEALARMSPAMRTFAEESRRVDTRRMCEVLGVTPRYPSHEAGLRAALAEEATARDGAVS